MRRSTPLNSGGSASIELYANGLSSVGGFVASETNKDTIVTAYTGADITTTIFTIKPISPDRYETITNTIHCTKDGANTIDVYY